MSLWTYIIRRIFQAIPLLFIISVISFLLMTLAPGDPTAIYENPEASSKGPQDLSNIEDMLGVNQPIYVQYYKWIKLILLEGNMGYSFEDGRPVLEKIFERIPATLWLTGTALIVSIIIAIPIGVYSAVKKYSFFDYLFTGYSFLGISAPTFYVGLIAILFFSLRLGWVPPSGMREIYDYFDWYDRFIHLVLPASVLAFNLVASKSRYMRSSMLEVIRQDYIRTARAKGLSEFKVIFKHALRNALLPIITIVALQLPILVGGAFIIEQIFAWPGLGRLSINAVFIRDYQVIMGTTMITSVAVVLCNLLADILYAIVDPRIQYGKN